MSNAKKKI